LKNNQLQSINVDADLPSITKIDLSGNELSSIFFPELDTLSTVILSNNTISDISKIDVSKLEKLSHLDVSYNSKLTEIDGLTSKSLQSLDVSSCHIRSVNLKKLKNLHTINISNNPIHKLNVTSTTLLKLLIHHGHVANLSTKKLAEELPNLKHLEVSHNKNIKLDFKHDHLSIQRVELQDVGLTEIAVDGLKSLEHVNFAYNSVPVITRRVFVNNPRITNLNISYLNLMNITDDAFSENENLLIVDASNNHLVSYSWVQNLPNLRALNLSFNKLETIRGDTLVNLTDLNLSDNKIETVSKGGLSMVFPSIRNINLRFNKIEYIPHLSSKTLKTLLLGFNQITTLSPETFLDLPELLLLDLEGNKLTHLSLATILKLPKLSILQLGHNPWHCDCKNSSFQELLSYLNSKSLTPLNSLKCDNTGETWGETCPTEKNDEVAALTKPIVFVGAILGILLFGVGISVFFKMYSMKYILPALPSHPSVDPAVAIQPEHPVYNTT